MKPTRKLTRRSFLGVVAGGVAAVGAVGLLASDEAEAQTGCTDSDTGSYADRPDNGRRCGHRRRRVYRSGCTDRDTGRYADPAGNGRCRSRRRSCTDSDTGSNADPAGRGRRC